MNKTVWVLHGWALGPGNDLKWQPLVESLAGQTVTAEFLALPGLDEPLQEVWGLEEYLTWLTDQLPPEPVVLLGHSFGGQLATKFAARYPDRVERLILIAPAGIKDRSLKATIKRTVFKNLAAVGKHLTRSERARKLLYKAAREQDYLQADPMLRQTMRNVINTEILDDIPKLSAQTLLIWGVQDQATPFRHHQYFLQNPQVEFEPIQSARHAPQFTHPELVAKTIGDFLQGNNS